MGALLNNIGVDGDDEEGLQGLLETMMSQLMSKEVLYEPLKEMHEKVRKYVFFFALQQNLNMQTVP